MRGERPLVFESQLDEQESEKEKPTDWSGVIIGLVLLPVYLFFLHLGKEDLGRNLSIILVGILLAVKVCWKLRSRPWFWLVILLVLAANVPLMRMNHWPDHWVPAVAFLPVALAEFLITIGAVKLVAKFFTANNISNGDEE